MKKRLQIFLLPAIIFIGLFFRLYHFKELFSYGHEQDLQAFIIKDIVIDHHFRLIGQETSITGVFIGPIYYYLLAIFFMLSSMDPVVSVIPTAIVAAITIVSIYYVFNKLFGKDTGYIGAFIYAVSLPIASLDRWAVPTQLTFLWTIWYFYVLFMFVKGKFTATPILIILVALIWHVHIAFIPLLVLIPVSIVLVRKSWGLFLKSFITKKALLAGFLAVILLTPFFLFEIRHGFQQLQGFYAASNQGGTVLHGMYKEELILDNINRTLVGFIHQDINPKSHTVFLIPSALIAFLLLIYFLYRRKQFTKNEILLLFLWIASVFIIHSISKRPFTQYYFNNLIILSLVVISQLFSFLYKIKELRMLIVGLAVFILFNNIGSLLAQSPLVNEYVDKKNAVHFIAEDARKHNFNCIGVNYIGDIGVEYGYRYLYWLEKLNVIAPGNDVPVYNLSIPDSISENEVNKSFGTIGVILAKNYKIDPSVCNSSSRQLQDLNGFVK